MTPRWPAAGGVPDADRLRDAVPSRRRLAALILVGNLQVVGVILYYAATSAALTEPRYVVYGLLWVNVGLLALYEAGGPAS